MRNVPPGIYEGIKNATYHTWDAVSSSQLKALRRSAYDLQKLWKGPSRQSPEMLVGELAHDLVLLPDVVGSRYVVAPEEFKTATSKKFDSFCEDAKKKAPLAAVVTQAQWDTAHAVLDAVKRHQAAKEKLFGLGGKNELSVVAKDPRSGLLLRARFDRITQAAIYDLKTARDASPKGFMRAAYWEYGYDLQAIHYLYVAKLAMGGSRTFEMIAVEKDTGDVGIYSFPTKWLRTLEKEYIGLLEQYAGVKAAPPMDGYTNGVETLPPPYRDSGIVVGGGEK
jgi:hypothetical protein